MGIRTSDDAKELFDKAMDLSDEDITILKELGDTGSALPVKLVAQLLISPNFASDKLGQLQEKGLVTSVQQAKRDIFASEGEEYFGLSDEGVEMITILPIVEKMRGEL